MFSLPFQLSFQQNRTSIFCEKYQEYLLTDSIAFFRLLMISCFFNSLMALLVFIIKNSGTSIITLISVITCIYFLLIFSIHKLKSYTQSAITLYYVFYVAAAVLITLSDQKMPLFISGYGTGLISCGIIQFCNPKFKLLFILVTPQIYLLFTNMFLLTYLHYIAFALTASSLLGLLTYQFETKQKLIYSQNIIIKNQQEIIKQFTSDNLFAFSYNKRDRQFKLEFSKASFENLYQDDVKQILRMFQVKPKNTCFLTIKERRMITKVYHFHLKKKQFENEQLQDVSILKTYFHYPTTAISLKSNINDFKI